MHNQFRPDTDLDLFTSFEGDERHKRGSRSSSMAFASSWTQIDLGRSPPPTRCCCRCNPMHPDCLAPAMSDDPCLHTFASDFLVPLVEAPSRPSSAQSAMSRSSLSSSASFTPLAGAHAVPQPLLDDLRKQLQAWREQQTSELRDYRFVPRDVDFPDRQISTLVSSATRFLNQADVTPRDICKAVQWDSATPAELQDVAEIIALWRCQAAISATPRSQHRGGKRSRRDTSAGVISQGQLPLAAPVFTADSEVIAGSPTALQLTGDSDTFGFIGVCAVVLYNVHHLITAHRCSKRSLNQSPAHTSPHFGLTHTHRCSATAGGYSNWRARVHAPSLRCCFYSPRAGTSSTQLSSNCYHTITEQHHRPNFTCTVLNTEHISCPILQHLGSLSFSESSWTRILPATYDSILCPVHESLHISSNSTPWTFSLKLL